MSTQDLDISPPPLKKPKVLDDVQSKQWLFTDNKPTDVKKKVGIILGNTKKRADLVEFARAIKKKTKKEIFDEYPHMIVKFPYEFDRITQHYLSKKVLPWRNVTVSVLWGVTGSGKTRSVYRDSPNVYRLDNYPLWDGYEGQKEILFDDFYGQIKATKMLQYLQGYPMRLPRRCPTKGSYTFALWDTVYITSWTHPDKWWTKFNKVDNMRISTISSETRKALNEKITNIYKLTVNASISIKNI